MSATRRNNCTARGVVLYMALELSEKTWKLGFATGLGQEPRLRNIPAGAVGVLKQEIEAAKERLNLPLETHVASCYEAGRDGFWLHRCLLAMGVANEVVDSSSIEIDRRKRRSKTDRIDVKKLLKMLIRNRQGEQDVWRTVRAPTSEEEDARQLHRELETLHHEHTSHINRIKGLLSSCGETLEIDRHLPKRLKQLRLWDGSTLPTDLHRRLLREFERMQVVNRQIRQLERERARRIRRNEKEPAVAQVRTLLRLKGIGVNSSWLYVREVFGWRGIKNRRQIGAIVGLTGSPYRSGSLDHEQGISKAGNRRMRAMAIEIAWGWLFHQPQSDLSRWYERRFAHGGKRLRRIGIVALARKLLVALWKYLETGVPPGAAELTDWRTKLRYTPSLT
jgi:transposase